MLALGPGFAIFDSWKAILEGLDSVKFSTNLS
jgi:hypothetical protein